MAAVRRPSWIAVMAIALVVRAAAVALSDRVVADVLRYRKVAEFMLAGRWNPYESTNLYPYPPLWVWWEVVAGWLSARSGIGFALLVKAPLVTADLAIVGLLWRWGRERGMGSTPAWLFALHPVSLLVTGFHGQFDTLMLLAVLVALRRHEQGRQDASALALAAAIGFKSFPVLLLPFVAARAGGGRAALRYGLVALAPVVVLLLPFAWADWHAVRRELFGYGGVADFGWIGLARGLAWIRTGVLERSEARYWSAAVGVAKAAFLLAWAALVVAYARGRLRLSTLEAALAVFLAFQVLYGALSAQYLLWVVPLAALLRVPRAAPIAYAAAATTALAGFYLFLQPAIVSAVPPSPGVTHAAGLVWVVGVAAVLAVSSLWLVALVRNGWKAAAPMLRY